MALLFRFNPIKYILNGTKLCSTSTINKTTSDTANQLNEELEKRSKDDMPVNMKNPFSKEKPQCILCKYDIEPNYKNVRLLSQFISRYTGRVYGRHITGLCLRKHKKVEQEVIKAQQACLMPVYLKNPKYLKDPDLYNESKPLRPHSYL